MTDAGKFELHSTPIAYNAAQASFGSIFSLEPIDLDDDNDIDFFALAGWHSTYRVSWWENDGSSESFTRHDISTDFILPSDLSLTDLNNDGDIDVVGVSGDEHVLVWWRNEGAAVFEKQLIASPKGIYSIVTVDLDADGDVDIVSSSSLEDEVAWWENDGSAEFSKRYVAGNVDSPPLIDIADMDGDGRIDVLSTASFGREILWWKNSGDGQFVRQSVTDSTYGTSSIRAADLNGDGLLGVLASSYDGKEIAWWEQLSEDAVGNVVLPDWDKSETPKIVSVETSSMLSDAKEENKYSGFKMFDGDPRTSWVEGKDDEGIGESVTIVISPPVKADALEIMPGYFDSRYWASNNRIASLVLIIADDVGVEHGLEVTLEDSMRPQTIEIGSQSIWKIHLKIESVYSGDRWNDTCLAELSVIRSGGRVVLLDAERVANTPPVDKAVSFGGQIDMWHWNFYRDGTFTHYADRPGALEPRLVENGIWSFSNGRIDLTVLYRYGERGVGDFQKPSSGDDDGPGPAGRRIQRIYRFLRMGRMGQIRKPGNSY